MISRTVGLTSLLTIFVMILSLLAVACSSSEPAPPTPPTPTPINVSAIIQEALKAQPAGASAEEVAAAVQSAMDAQTGGVTEAQVADAIANALENRPGVTEAQVGDAIAGALVNMPSTPGVTEAQMASAISDALSRRTPGLTEAQVADAIANALLNRPGVTEAQVADAMANALLNRPGVTEAQVGDAIARAMADMPSPVVEVRAELDPLIVGNLNGFTGPLTEFATPLRNSVDLAASHVNRAGGVQGASMVVISRDTAVNPVQGVDSARALVDVENSVAIVGALSSGVTIAVANSVTIPKGRLLISGASTAPAITTLEDNDLVFRTAPSDAAQGVVLANLANEEGYKTAGVLYLNNAYGEGLADQFSESFTALGGTVTAKVPHEDAQPTYVSELVKATEGNPDVLVTISYTGQAAIYLRESLEGGYADTFLFVDGVKGSELMEKVGWDALEGTLGTAPGGPDRPEKIAFESAYLETYGYPVSHPFMAEHYDATVLIALAAARAGSTTDSAAIRDAIRDVANGPGVVVGPGRDGIARAFTLIAEGKDINYEGASGIVDIDENGDVFGPIEIWKVEGGEIVSTGRFETP